MANDSDETILIEPTASVGRAAIRELKKLGVESKRSAKADFRSIGSWHQAIPLVESPDYLSDHDNSEVLFEIVGEEQLPVVVGEMLRLGNDRQSFRFVGENGTPRALLRVTSPPYYTMLRATDRAMVDGASEGQLGAYVQQSSRVWVEVGCRHPLGDRIEPPAGQWLLISRDNKWRFLKEGAFRDVYETLELQLPGETESFVDCEPASRIAVPLRLSVASSQEPAELWVLTDNATMQIENLVRRSDDQIISRLAFAVTEDSDSPPTVVIRARPSKQLPPVLVLDAVAFRPYLKIPNLFLPTGMRLHPPLRRDAVVKLLASQTDQITWLMPSDDNSFKPQKIPDVAFRPMSDWIDYVIDHQSEPLDAWVASHRFDFEHFVCRDDIQDKSPPPRRRNPSRPSADVADSVTATPDVVVKKKRGSRKKTAEDPQLSLLLTEEKVAQPNQLQAELRDLESEFRQSDEPLDGPSRSEMWRQMGMVNAALKHRHDATVCFANSLWDQPTPSEEVLAQWLRCEQNCSAIGEVSEATLDRLISDRSARSSDPSLVASYLVWASFRDPVPKEIVERQTALTSFLQTQESYLPIRTAWLAWCAMYSMSGNDVLLLARARDRLLERLFNQGLMPEFDMAAFMRSGGASDSNRFRVLRDEVLRLREMVGRWIVEPVISTSAQTKSYADLVFAYALARLGETAQCHEALTRLGERLKAGDPIHRWVYNAFSMRIKQALAGQATQGHLSDELLQQLEAMERMDRYKLDRLRQHSRILEPHVRIDPYRNWHQRYADDLSRDLAMLQNIVDRDELSTRITQLIHSHTSAGDRIRILPAVLQLSPRVGEQFACELLGHVPSVIKNCRQSMQKALVLQRALHIAAHYGRVELVHQFVTALTQSLPAIVEDYLAIEAKTTPENKEKAEAIESLLSQSFRGLRKLGMRDEIGRLYGHVADLVQAGEGGSKSRKRKAKGEASRSQRLLLCVAGGWYYFGQEDSARSIADKVRGVLADGELPSVEQKSLSCAYLDAVSQAPVEEALGRVQQIFSLNEKGEPELPRISDSMTTCSHFSISQLDVVEAAVLSLISDDFSLSTEARRWLDEDEFLVRSRIHRDMHRAAGS